MDRDEMPSGWDPQPPGGQPGLDRSPRCARDVFPTRAGVERGQPRGAAPTRGFRHTRGGGPCCEEHSDVATSFSPSSQLSRNPCPARRGTPAPLCWTVVQHKQRDLCPWWCAGLWSSTSRVFTQSRANEIFVPGGVPRDMSSAQPFKPLQRGGCGKSVNR